MVAIGKHQCYLDKSSGTGCAHSFKFHPLSTAAYSYWGPENLLESTPALFGREAGTGTHHRQPCKLELIPTGTLETPINPRWMFLDCGRKLDLLEKTHTTKKKHVQTPHRKSFTMNWTRNLQESPNHCPTPNFKSFLWTELQRLWDLWSAFLTCVRLLSVPTDVCNIFERSSVLEQTIWPVYAHEGRKKRKKIDHIDDTVKHLCFYRLDVI